jgi:hypothetical protein
VLPERNLSAVGAVWVDGEELVAAVVERDLAVVARERGVGRRGS